VSGSITTLDWIDAGPRAQDGILGQTSDELEAYFSGDLKDFSVPLAPEGSEFQLKFWRALCAIPFGETRTYSDLAADLGVPAQAIGQACGSNPIPILIPCHRVLAANSLGGFSGAGGVEAKVALLKLEGAASFLI
jgi:methylated-DNA-[protein]-cysteine S-methyltransferase